MTYDKNQSLAIERACTSRVCLISGGAGTGKTTIVRAIADRIEAEGGRPKLCAFAGKAAARLREACQRPAYTIHRVMGWNGSRFMCETLEGLSIIVDEASMLPASLLAAIIERKPARLVLVGDEAQLPPVGEAQPYHDLLALRPQLATNLTHCYRNSEAVFKAASAIRTGICPPMQLTTPGESWALINTGDARQTQAQVLEWATGPDWDFEQDIILCPRNGEAKEDGAMMEGTVRGLNAAIAQAVLPRAEGVKFVVGDRIICGHNFQDKDVWNGTTGTVAGIDTDGSVWMKTDVPVIDHNRTAPDAENGSVVYTDRVLFTRGERNELSLAYALTTHKAQGSQARNVLVVCLSRDIPCNLISRSWLYTSVTRARAAAVVCGQVAAFKAGIQLTYPKRTVIQELAG